MSQLVNKPRLRLAPSPTGFLHLGNLRTALFGYLLAKKWGGDFILRLEDTDEKRYVPGAVENLIKVFKILGIEFSEGPHEGGDYGPYIQSQRLNLYKAQAEKLVDLGQAYYCFATSQELEAMRQQQIERHEPPRYDRRFRDLPVDEARQKINQGQPYVIRHKLPLAGEIVVHDELRGDIVFKAEDLEDYILLKSDGYPTYQLASVVDDHLMAITHVTRGEEWLPSLPKNYLLYQACGWEVPKFIHLPLILNKTGGKLSKRQGDVFVEDYFKKGYLAEALINFCALLGWHPKTDQEIFSLAELEKNFELDGLGISPAIFDQEKLDWLNGYYLRQKSLDELLVLALPFLKSELNQTKASKKHPQFIKAVLALEQPRLKTLAELPTLVNFFFQNQLVYEPELLYWKSLTKIEVKLNLGKILNKIKNIPEENWTKDNLETELIKWLKDENYKPGDYLWPMRVSLSGRQNSPSPFEIAAVLGKEETMARINFASSLLS